MIRGCSYISLATAPRSAERETLHTENRHDDTGLRLALATNP